MAQIQVLVRFDDFVFGEEGRRRPTRAAGAFRPHRDPVRLDDRGFAADDFESADSPDDRFLRFFVDLVFAVDFDQAPACDLHAR